MTFRIWKSSGLINHLRFYSLFLLTPLFFEHWEILFSHQSAPGLRYRSFTLRENFVRPALFSTNPQKPGLSVARFQSSRILSRLSYLLARVSPPFHYGETLRSLLFPSLQSPPPLSIPAKIKKPMKHPVRNKINLSKNHTNITNNFSKNTQKHKNTSTEKVPRIPHIYIQNSYELLAGLTNL